METLTVFAQKGYLKINPTTGVVLSVVHYKNPFPSIKVADPIYLGDINQIDLSLVDITKDININDVNFWDYNNTYHVKKFVIENQLNYTIISENCEKLYNEGGATPVYEYCNSLGLSYSVCKECDTETPDVKDLGNHCECAICGTTKRKK